jgi:serine/threonine protein kinase
MTAESSPTFLALQGALAGRYALERELGRGGMGIVYLARDLSLDRPVAIKLLPPTLAGIPRLRERFLREARTAARLSHPNIVPIHSVEEHGEFVLFVMGYIDGETLADRIARRGPLAAEPATRLLQEVAWALAFAHQHGVIHRDIKPENILLERAGGRALVSDFGIAHVETAEAEAGSGEVVGTVRYMSPEQQAGRTVDRRSDIYSLGVTAGRVLEGRRDVPPRLAAIIE